MTLEFSVGKANLKRLIAEYSPLGELSNEAQTRFSFIDAFLQECLGWSKDAIHVEVYEDGDRTDYECGVPRRFIVEAKRSSTPLRFPPRGTRTSAPVSIRSLSEFDDVVKNALMQVQGYCQTRGVQYAALSTASQLVLFLATRVDGVAPLDGKALVFDGYDELVKGFSVVFETASPAGVSEKRLDGMLEGRSPAALPPKLSSTCLNYFDYKYSNNFQQHLRNAASLVIEDIGRTSDLEKEFLRDCYCESGPLTQYSLLGRNILSARYAALFGSAVAGSQINSVNPRKQDPENFSSQAIAEAMARRPIVLVGDVGVGKTSFLKHLIQISADEIFRSAVCIYFDLGSKGALSRTARDSLLDQIEKTLRKEFDTNLQDSALLSRIYADQLADFDSGVFGQLRSSAPELFIQRRVEFLSSLIQKREEHLRLVIGDVARIRHAQVVIVIDNADQRSPAVQQEAFVIAQELCANWSALVFLALRPQTFHSSKRSGAVSAYPPKVFVIPPPKLEDAIEKRLAFAQRLVSGREGLNEIQGLTLHIESLGSLIKILRESLSRNKELHEFIVNVSSGNVRQAIELISHYFGNPNVESDKILKIYEESGSYHVPIHEFAKAALLGDYAHFQEEASVASNIYSVFFPDSREHFLSLLILGFMCWDGAIRSSSEGFVSASAVLLEMQGQGFRPEQIEAHLVILVRKKLVETSERRVFESEGDMKEQGMPDSYRVTSLGAYHVKKWASDFGFMEAMCFDTPIFDSAIRTDLTSALDDNRLPARFQRADAFRCYLDDVWNAMKPLPYFDWTQLRAVGEPSFRRVESHLRSKSH